MERAIYELFSSVATTTPSSHTVRENLFRFDASFHSSDSEDARRALRQSGAKTDTIAGIADVRCSGIRDRVFVDSDHGITLLVGSTLDVTTDEDAKFVSRTLTSNLALESLCTNDILVSSAGTVGKPDFVHRNHEGKLASQDLIRIRPKGDNPPAGYVYAFISSPLAQKLILNRPAGSVVVRIYEEDLRKLPLPRLSAHVEERIASKVTSAYDARADARELVAEAVRGLITCCGLPKLPGERFSRHRPEDDPCLIAISSRQLLEGDVNREYRLDANFFNPIAQQAIANIKKYRGEVKTVGEVTEQVFLCNRFARTFVERDHGIPFLAGKNIVQIRPTDVAYLSRTETSDLDQLRLQRDWILLTRSGTIGRTCLVHRNFEEFVGTDDLIRIVPDKSHIDGGYLYAFLSTEYGRQQVLRFRHGSVIDHITPDQVKQVLIPRPSEKEQTSIGDQVREAYEKRAEAIRLEDEAQALLMNELTRQGTSKGK